MNDLPAEAPKVAVHGLVLRRGRFQLGPVDLRLNRGRTLAILGPSGSGKSSLLDAIAGFELPHEGRIELDGAVASRARSATAPSRRGCAMLLEEVGLFDHLDASSNCSLVGAAAVEVERLLVALDLGERRHQLTADLSGGERQRVAIARVLAAKAELCLFDEPLARLHRNARERTAALVRDETSERTTIVACHELDEALSFGPDRLLLLHEGRVLAEGPTEELLRQPGRRDVAEQLGYETFLRARLEGSGLECALGSFELSVTPVVPRRSLLLAFRPGQVGLAEDLGVEPGAGSAGRVEQILAGGGGWRARVRLESNERVNVRTRLEVKVGTNVAVMGHRPVVVEDTDLRDEEAVT